MPDLIDYEFISEREGGRRKDGYLPAAEDSKSGVTVATGFDLGARNLSDLNNLGFDKTLVDKLKPYLGKQKKAAADLLATSPLTLTDAETEKIDKAVKKKQLDLLKSRYLAVAENKDKVDFFDLPAQAQTVIASVSFQYGNLETKAPTFWKAAAAQSWADTVKVLNKFGDVYTSRRKLEAGVLAALLPKPAPTPTPAVAEAK